MRIAVVSVPVSDQERAKQFYVGVLGFRVLADTPTEQGRWVMLEPAGGGAAITLVTWFPSMPPGSTRGLVYEVDDLDSLYADLFAKGVEFTNGITEAPWGRYVMLDDPDGNGLILQQPPEN